MEEGEGERGGEEGSWQREEEDLGWGFDGVDVFWVTSAVWCDSDVGWLWS